MLESKWRPQRRHTFETGIPDVDDDTPLFPAKGKRKSGIPVVDDDTPLFPFWKNSEKLFIPHTKARWGPWGWEKFRKLPYGHVAGCRSYSNKKTAQCTTNKSMHQDHLQTPLFEQSSEAQNYHVLFSGSWAEVLAHQSVDRCQVLLFLSLPAAGPS